MLILVYLYLNTILNAGLLLVIKYFYIMILLLLLLNKRSEYFFHHCHMERCINVFTPINDMFN